MLLQVVWVRSGFEFGYDLGDSSTITQTLTNPTLTGLAFLDQILTEIL